jgi:RNA recognition motif-containing protein
LFYPEEELRKHFEQYGRVEDVEWPFDKQSKARKNFAFVVFEAEEAADLAAASPKQQFANREVSHIEISQYLIIKSKFLLLAV